MQRSPNKKEIRRDLERQVEDYLRNGGQIKAVRQGTSGLEKSCPWSHPFHAGPSGEPKPTRTPIPDVVAAIEARKHKAPTPRPKRSKPRKQWIYDDFGEPVRWVWKE